MSLLRSKSIIFFIKRLAMSNIHLTHQELCDIYDNLSPQEGKLYSLVKHMAMSNAEASDLKNPKLAKELGISERVVSNIKASLKQKGYLIINFSKDAEGDLLAQVYVGKDQVALYNAGLKVEISNSKKYNELLRKFPQLLDTSIPLEQRKEMAKQANDFFDAQGD